MNYEKELNKALKKLRDIELALNESSIVAITDHQGVIQFANEKFCEMSQYSQEELIGSKQNIVNSGFHDREFFKEMWRTIGTGNIWKGEIKNRAKDGTYYWVDTTIVPFLKDDGKPYQYIAIRHDITKRKNYEETIKKMAYYDPLTMLPNRNMLNEWVSNYQGETITVLFLDIDRFKSVNDNFGHRTGDKILQELAKRLKKTLRKTDFIVRQGGDEFIIFLDGVDNRVDVMSVVNKINEQFNAPFFIHDKVIVTTTSIGISMNKKESRKGEIVDFIEMAIRQADTAMYHAKKRGGNTYCFNTHDQNNEINRYYQLEYEIETALNQNQFSVVYQPFVHLKYGHITGIEALLRWHNPTLGSVSPVEFIPILEERGLIIPVGRWVLKTVCEQMVTWHRNGIDLKKISVNVSPIQFNEKDFVKDIKDILEETGLEPQYLELEITEGTLLHVGQSEETFHKLRDLGVTISIDDFGTGYSSLSYLKQLPINTLKIDKSFIDDLSIHDEVIVNTIITMGKHLSFNVIAEGIENEEQLNYLKEQDCPEGQGYYWSKPIEANQITKLFQERAHF